MAPLLWVWGGGLVVPVTRTGMGWGRWVEGKGGSLKCSCLLQAAATGGGGGSSLVALLGKR